MKQLVLCLAIAVSAAAAARAGATPTPVPGGANQASGVQGAIGAKLFNGEVRLQPTEIRYATAADGFSDVTDQRWIVFSATASNGTHKPLDMSQFIASIVDAQGNTIQAQPDKVRPMGGVYGVPPGGGWKEQIFFLVPKDFVPDKVVLQPYDGKHGVFRISIASNDLH